MTKQEECEVLLSFWSLPSVEQARLVPQRFPAIHYFAEGGAGEVFTIRPYYFLVCLSRDLFRAESLVLKDPPDDALNAIQAVFTILIESSRSYPFLFDSTSENEQDMLGLAPVWIAVRLLARLELDLVTGRGGHQLSLEHFVKKYGAAIDESNFESVVF